jgi:hypothetical protein
MEKTNEMIDNISKNLTKFEEQEIKKFKKPMNPPTIFVSAKSSMSVKSNFSKDHLPLRFVKAYEKFRDSNFYDDLIRNSTTICKIFLEFKHRGRQNSDIVYLIYRFITINKITTPDLITEFSQIFPKELKKMVTPNHWVFQILTQISLISKDMQVHIFSNPNNAHQIINLKIKSIISFLKYGRDDREAPNEIIIQEFLESIISSTEPYFHPFLQWFFDIHTKLFGEFMTNTIIPSGIKPYNVFSAEKLFRFVVFFIYALGDIGASLTFFISKYTNTLNELITKMTPFQTANLNKLRISAQISIEDIPFLLFEMKNAKFNLKHPHSAQNLLKLKTKLKNFTALNLISNLVIQKHFQALISNSESVSFQRNYFGYRNQLFNTILSELFSKNDSVMESHHAIPHLIQDSLNLPSLSDSCRNLIESIFKKSMETIEPIDAPNNADSLAIIDIFRLRFDHDY